MNPISATAARILHDRHNRSCRHSVAITPFTGRDQYGDQSYGSPITYAALVIFRQQSVVNGAGEQQGARGSASLAFNSDGTSVAVNEDSKITLPDGTTPVIIAVERDPGSPALVATCVYF